MIPGQGDAILDVYDCCQEVTAAYHQFRQRGRSCRQEYGEAIKKLARSVKEATAKGVSEGITTRLVLEQVPTEALKQL